MKANQKANVTDVSQQRVCDPQSELNVIERKIKNNQALSEEDVKFVDEFSWLSAPSVLVANLAVGL